MNNIWKTLTFISIFLMCNISIHASADTRKNSTKEIINVPLDNDLWIGAIVPSNNKNTFWSLEFKGSRGNLPYQLSILNEHGSKKIVELPIHTDEINSPYFYVSQICFFKIIEDNLFIGIKKENNNIDIAIVDTLNIAKSPQTINLKPHTNSELFLDNHGNIFTIGMDDKLLLNLQKINAKGDVISKKKSLNNKEFRGTRISASLFLNDSFYISLIGDPTNYDKSEVLQLNCNGEILNHTILDGIIYEFYPTMEKQLLAIMPGNPPNEHGRATILSSTLGKNESYNIPSFFDLKLYEGNMFPLNDGSLLHIKRVSEQLGDGNVDIIRYCYNQAPETLVNIQNKSERKSVVYNLINTLSDNMLTLGVSYEEINDNKSQKYFKIYQLDTTSN